MESSQFLVCRYCSYNGNPDTATHCEICGRPLKRHPVPTNDLPSNRWRTLRNWIVPALLLVVAVESIYLIWSRQSVSNADSASAPEAHSNCIAPGSVEQQDRLSYTQICSAMRQVLNVPEGQFIYSGAMAAAPLRSERVLDNINQAHPEFRLRYTDPLNVPPDSGKGISMLIDGELSFAESFRPLRSEEYNLARARGFSLKQIPVAIGAIAFYTHPGVKLPGLSMGQVQAIFTGEVTNWRQLGGPNLSIVPVSQDPEAKNISNFLLEGLPTQRRRLGRKVQVVRDTTTSIRKVAATPGAIGYGAQALVVGQQTIHLLGLAKGQSQNYVQPATPEGQINKEALRDGSYPLIRRIFVIVREDGQLDELAGVAYANLLLSKEGQQLVDRAGYLPIR